MPERHGFGRRRKSVLRRIHGQMEDHVKHCSCQATLMMTKNIYAWPKPIYTNFSKTVIFFLMHLLKPLFFFLSLTLKVSMNFSRSSWKMSGRPSIKLMPDFWMYVWSNKSKNSEWTVDFITDVKEAKNDRCRYRLIKNHFGGDGFHGSAHKTTIQPFVPIKQNWRKNCSAQDTVAGN